MKLKALSLAAIFALGVVPIASHAGTSPAAALDACVKSFVQTHLPGHPVKKVTQHSPAESAMNRFWRPNSYTILLSARGVDSGTVIAEARCVASRNGIVVVLDQPSRTALREMHADSVVSMR